MPSSKRPLSLRCLYGPCNSYFISTPIGTVRVTSCTHGLHSITQEDDPKTQPDPCIPVVLLRKEFDDNGYSLKPAVSCIDWLETYFQSPEKIPERATPSLCHCVCSPKGQFLERVWLTLKDQVPLGSTTTYAGLAKLAGNPGAAMAVGSAMRRNPFPLLVPCHRVVKSNGQNGNYCGGERNHVKDWLLQHEKGRLLSR